MVDVVIAVRKLALLFASSIGLLFALSCTKAKSIDVPSDSEAPPSNAYDGSSEQDLDAGDSDDISVDAATIDAAVTILPNPDKKWRAVTPVSTLDLQSEIAAAFIVPSSGAPYVALLGSLSGENYLSSTGYPPGTGMLNFASEDDAGSLHFTNWSSVQAPNAGTGTNSYTGNVAAIGPTASSSGNTLTVMWAQPATAGYDIVAISGTPGPAGTSPTWGSQFYTNGQMIVEGTVTTEDPTNQSQSPTPFQTFSLGTSNSAFYWWNAYNGTSWSDPMPPKGHWQYMMSGGSDVNATYNPLEYGIASSWTFGGGIKVFAVYQNQLYWTSRARNTPENAWTTFAALVSTSGGDSGTEQGLPIFQNVWSAPAAVWCGNKTVVVIRDVQGNIKLTTRDRVTRNWSLPKLVADVSDPELPAALKPLLADASIPTPEGAPPMPSPAIISRTSIFQDRCEYEIFVAGSNGQIYAAAFQDPPAPTGE